jgi:DNA-binding GntR family transcriptional regulator
MTENISTTHSQPVEAVRTFRQQAYNVVKARILNRDLKPGQNITDSQIAAELNISRTPVREALRELEHEGFLINQPRQGWRVYSLSLEDIHEIFDIKVALEGMLARQAAQCTDSEKQATLREAIEQMKQAVALHDYAAWRQADIELHRAIFAMGMNGQADRIIDNLNEQWYRLRIGFLALQGRTEQSCREHEPVVTAILAGDGDAAESQMRLHINNVRQELVHLLVNLVLPFTQAGV